MGTQKLLLPFAGTTVVSHIVGRVVASTVEKTCVVVGHQAGEVTRELAGSGASIIYNEQYESGMLSSVRAGLRHVPGEFVGVLVALGDQPTITTAVINGLLSTFRAADTNIVVPVHNGRRGHPIVIPARFRDEILSNYDEAGLRGFVRAHPEAVLEMNVADAAVCADMDYPSEYRQRTEEFETEKSVQSIDK